MQRVDAAPTVEIVRESSAWLVSVRGSVDDRFPSDFVERVAADPAPVIIDVDAVTRISSFGVREWMRALKRLATREIFLVRCRPVIVAQLNSVANFAAGGQVVSFYCPYSCSTCSHSFDVLIDLRRMPDVVAKRAPPVASCPSCGAGGAVFDDLEEVYFASIAQQPPLSISPALESVIDGGREAPKPLRVLKSVEGDITGLWLQGTLDGRARVTRSAADLEGKVVVFLGGATLPSPEGIHRLRDIIDSERAEVFLVDVPLPIAVALTDAGLLQRAPAVSVVVVRPCPGCGSDVRLDARAPVTNTVSCQTCATSFPGALSAEELAQIARVPVSAIPDDIWTFIKTRPMPASVTPSETRRRPDGTPGARIGRYEVIRRIGLGGMAEILLGRQQGPHGFEKKVVIKRILPHLAAQESFLHMFLQEARIAARLVHSNVVQIYDLGKDGDDYFIVMEYVAGVDLNGIIRLSRRLHRPLPIGMTCRIVADFCAGLHAAHTYRQDDGTLAPILHRDVSPHNVMVGLDGTVKITDFGIAKANDSVRTTESGLLKGKLIYMSPEQVRGGAKLDARMDVFAAALVLYVCLTLENPFQRGTEVESMRAILEAKVPPVSSKREGLPPELVAIVSKALAPEIDDRYQSAEKLQMALERFLEYREQASNAALARWLHALIADARKENLLVEKRTVPAPVVMTAVTVAAGSKPGGSGGSSSSGGSDGSDRSDKSDERRITVLED